jgi:hypothetical protein
VNFRLTRANLTPPSSTSPTTGRLARITFSG